ncbi:TetR/AcrR family transcriptional regulator [Streptomyces yangpuensis]|uniref:TetR/AcrR family transcriptional regulator n=1 Tax=Streptomyces yangpuensis TaxID=1648182 RepID=UPI00362FB2B6
MPRSTLFRHFPTKEALLEAVLVRRLEAIAAQTARLAAEMEPADAFFACFRLVVEQSPGKNEFAQARAAAGWSRPPRPWPAGTARLLADTSTTMEHLGPDPASRQRIFNVIFDGLRSH